MTGANHKVTLKDIAEKVGRSVATISLALSGSDRVAEKTRNEIQQACVALGYRTEDELEVRLAGGQLRKRKKRFALVMLMGETLQVLGSFLDALSDHVLEFNASLEVVKVNEESPDGILQALRGISRDVDGILLAHLLHAEVYERLPELNVPMVIAGSVIGGHHLPQSSEFMSIVDVNVRQMGRYAVALLAGCGYESIALFNTRGPKGLYFDSWHDGFLLGLRDNGLDGRPASILYHDDAESVAERARVRETLSKLPSGTAFLIPSISFAQMVLEVTGEMGLDVGPHNVILGGSERHSGVAQMGHYPCLTPDLDILAHTAFHLLDQCIREKVRKGLHIHTPFKSLNIEKLKMSR